MAALGRVLLGFLTAGQLAGGGQTNIFELPAFPSPEVNEGLKEDSSFGDDLAQQVKKICPAYASKLTHWGHF